MSGSRRIQREIEALQNDNLGFPFFFEIDDVRTEERVEEFTDVENHVLMVTYPFDFEFYLMKMEFPLDYPFSPPVVTFANEISHPSIRNEEFIMKGHSPIVRLSHIIMEVYGIIQESLDKSVKVNILPERKSKEKVNDDED
ncbi:MAG: hypothetical protein Solivirus2_25 [Solivirus sp.]|uniref:E2 ubiquitin-conjugating enzyme n=1 Tax=Solivirus sp. TaxID=2487772 RepID=A0A3G5AH86_9VIRU|nr:MAG: hypothetical protein Solivirus2_25 [Solivirus sp.]